MSGRLRAGYFPCPLRPLELLRERLLSTNQPYAVLDPCCGEGEAIQHLAGNGNVYCVELDPARGEATRQRLPEAKVLAPATIFQTSIARSSFGLVYCNPPFDDAMDGGRMETKFLQAVLPLVCERGLIVMVVPEHVTQDYDFRNLMNAEFDQVSQGAFPQEHRKYGEVFIVGVRRKEPKEEGAYEWEPADLWQTRYAIPPSKGPGKQFCKAGYTDEELLAVLASSPLRRMTLPKQPTLTPAPPMALGAGHLALLLAAGFLDGVVDPGPADELHVVRGVARKQWQQKESTTEVTDESERKVTVLEEQMTITVRAAYQRGDIVDFTDQSHSTTEDTYAQAH